MPEARDRRRPTADDVAAIFTNRRPSIFGASELGSLPIGPVPTPELAPTTGSDRIAIYRDPIHHRRARPLHAPSVENTSPASTRRVRVRAASRGVLPSWYPRTPLRDISAVVRAIERRRTRIGNEEEEQTETPLRIHRDDQPLSDPSSASSSRHVFHNAATPSSSISIKIRTPYGSEVPKILLDISKMQDEEGDSEVLTPQKKLLNSIDEVEKVVKQELQKLKRTPTAKRAEREKRVRTLMSMR